MPEAVDPGPSVSARWRDGLAIINLRGRPEDTAFVQACRAVLGVPLPVEPCRTIETAGLRIVWAGPDDWFVVGPTGQAGDLAARWRTVLAGLDAAVTDVSCGYTVLQLAGPSVRHVLACGCPLDLHPRAFGPGDCAGSHFFKASVWLWQSAPAPCTFELLVRRSFRGYVDLMLERSMPMVGVQPADR